MKKILILLWLLYSFAGALLAQKAASRLAQRVLGDKAVCFEFRISPAVKGTIDGKRYSASGDYFLVNDCSDCGKVIITANNDNSLAMGLNCYLQECQHIYVGWSPEREVVVPSSWHTGTGFMKVQQARVPYRFFLNYCTYGYTMPWWTWKEWEHFIDWMALNGINMPLALTGQEAVWQEVWRSYGMSDDAIRSYFSGPAHLPWHRMANLDGFGGPLPQHWIDAQKKLQKMILKRERELNMTPVLPAFAGHVPHQIAVRYPKADITTLSPWCGFESTYFLNSTDPLFADIQRRYLKYQHRLYGTDHIYGIDPFNEMDPPSWEPEYLAGVSKNIYQSLTAVDPQAQWLQMSWVFYYKRKQWTPERLKAYLTAVPQGKMILLDYFCENTEVWRHTDQFYGQPFVWCYLGNFGGNTMLVGNLPELDQKLNSAMLECIPSRGAADGENHPCGLIGVGSTLEAFDCSPHTYEYLFDRVWRSVPSVDDSQRVAAWSDCWALLDGGDSHSQELWRQLIDSIYRDWSFYGLGTQMVARPTLTGHGTYYTKPAYSYSNQLLYRLLLRYANSTTQPLSTDYQFINLVSQWMGNQFMVVRDKFAVAYRHRNLLLMRQQADEAMRLIYQADSLLSFHPSFRLDRWISDARRWGTTPAEQDYYEQQARTLLTVWGGPILNDYANRMWSGLLADYYARRWQMFFDETINAVANDTEFDQQAFDQQLSLFEHRWTKLHASVARMSGLVDNRSAKSDAACEKSKGDSSPTSGCVGNREKLFNDILNRVFSRYQTTDAYMAWNRITDSFPQSNLQDFYKNCFQERFGTGHLVGDERRQGMIDYINSECAYMVDTEHWTHATATASDFEYNGFDGNYVRVNLGLVIDSLLSAEFLADCFIRGAFAVDSAEVADWHCRWDMMMVELLPYSRRIGSFSADSTALQQVFAKGQYAFHHSRRFNEAYHYHYRLIRRDIFCEEILPVLRRAGRVHGTLDPRSSEWTSPLLPRSIQSIVSPVF